MIITDIQMPSGGTVYRHIRSYNNLDLINQDGPNGYGWKSSDLPYIERKRIYRAVFSEHDSVNFSLRADSQGIHRATSNFPDILQIDSTAREYIVTRSNGKVWTFSSDASTGVPSGMLKSVLNVSGDVTEFVYNSDFRIWKVLSYKRSAPSILLAQMEYEYYSNGRIKQITLQERDGSNLQNVKRVVYSYYSSAEENGSYDDLKTVTTQLFVNNTWENSENYYYRYYKTGQSRGAEHLIKMAFFPADWESFVKAYGVPACMNAEDANALAFATKYYEYDEQNRVVQERIDRNRRSMQFQYVVYPENSDYNAVSNKTITTNAQGEVSVIFTNFKGDVILRENTPPNGCQESSVIYYYQYNNNGKRTHSYSPKSVLGYTVQLGYPVTLSVNISPDEGKVEISQYGDDIVSPKDKVIAQYVQQGGSGNPILLRQYSYEKRQLEARVKWNVVSVSEYPDETGSNPITTQYTYEYYDNSLSTLQKTTIHPAVSPAHNGSGMNAVRYDRYDQQGRVVWSKDELGIITYHQYDSVLNVEVKTIQDVDTTKTDDFTAPVPSSWATVAGAGQHLITEQKYDFQGRLVETLGPKTTSVNSDNQSVTTRQASWFVYDDAAHEVRSASGFATYLSDDNVIFTLVNPVSITRRSAFGAVTDQIQARRISTNGKLLPTDTFIQADYLAWTINVWDGSDLVSTRQYFDIPVSGHGELNVNYYQTCYFYDQYGRRSVSISPDGTITKTVFDWKNNPTQTWIGTSRENMVLVSETIYSGETGCPTCTGTTSQPRLNIQYADAQTMRITEFGYDWRGRRIHTHYEEDAQGRSTFDLSTYDNLDRVIKSEKFLSNDSGDDMLLARIEQFYNERGQVWKTEQSVVDPNTGAVEGKIQSLNWHDEAGKTVKTQAPGEVKQSRTVYNSLGRVIKTDVALPDGTVYQQTEYVYDAVGHVIMTVSAERQLNQSGTGALLIDAAPQGRFHFTASWFDGAGREIASANFGTNGNEPLVAPLTVPARSDTVLLTETFYDSATGRTYKTIDPAGNITENIYNTLGNVVKRILPKPVASSSIPEYVTEYDNIGRVVSRTDPMGNKTQTVYGDFSRVVAIIDPMNNRTEYSYNRIGELIAQTDPRGNITRFVYDNLGRRIQIIQPKPSEQVDNSVITMQYSPLGQVVQIIDALGNVTSMEYDGLGRLIAKIDPLSGRTSYLYDAVGHLLSLTDSVNNTTTFGYDIIGRIISETNTLGKTRTIEYFAGNLVSKKTDRLGRYITFEYDRFNNKTVERWYSSNGILERTMNSKYDSLRRLTHFSDPDSEFEFLYDKGGRNTHIITSFNGLNPTLQQVNSFNLNNRRTAAELRIGIVNDSQVVYEYNANNQTTSIMYSSYTTSDKRVEYSYNSALKIAKKSSFVGNQSIYQAEFTYDNMNRQMGITYLNGESQLVNYGLSWDAKRIIDFSSNLEEQSIETAIYSYDNTDQLVSSLYNAFQPNESYSYDANGNRTMKGYTTSVNNHLTNDGNYRYEYDDEGNCLAKIPNSGYGVTVYLWDHRNRLIKTITPSDTITYAYDHLNRLIRRNDEYFVHDNYQITTVLNSDGTVKKRFFWGTMEDELIVELPVSGCSIWALTDHQGTIRDVINDSAELINHLRYSAFGKLVSQTNNTYQPFFLYTGKFTDPTTNLQYNINRWYNPSIGRWMSEDPIGFDANDTNLYRYVGNQSIRLLDTKGLQFSLNIVDNFHISLEDPESWSFLELLNTPNKDIYYDFILPENELKIIEQLQESSQNVSSLPNTTGLSPDAEREFLEWYIKEYQKIHKYKWTDILPACPCQLDSEFGKHTKECVMLCDIKYDYHTWEPPSNISLSRYHPKAFFCIRSRYKSSNNVYMHGEQCCYDDKLQLITKGKSAGSSDFVSPGASLFYHYINDVHSFELAQYLDRGEFGYFTHLYFVVRPALNKNNCPVNEGFVYGVQPCSGNKRGV